LQIDLYRPIECIFEALILGINLTLSKYASPQRIRVDPYVNKCGLYDVPQPQLNKEIEDVEAAFDAYEDALDAREPETVRVK
jgi:hypothetical protein